jgi:hypothetical protein
VAIEEMQSVRLVRLVETAGIAGLAGPAGMTGRAEMMKVRVDLSLFRKLEWVRDKEINSHQTDSWMESEFEFSLPYLIWLAGGADQTYSRGGKEKCVSCSRVYYSIDYMSN